MCPKTHGWCVAIMIWAEISSAVLGVVSWVVLIALTLLLRGSLMDKDAAWIVALVSIFVLSHVCGYSLTVFVWCSWKLIYNEYVLWTNLQEFLLWKRVQRRNRTLYENIN